MASPAARHRQLEDEPRLRRGRAPRPAARRALEEPPVEHTDVVVAPPFVDLRSVAFGHRGRAPRHRARRPAREPARQRRPTPARSALAMLERLGVAWVIVGHSERRRALRDGRRRRRSDAAQRRARGSATPCSASARPSTLREAGEHEAFVDAQLRSAPRGARRPRRSASSPSPTSRSGRSAPGSTPTARAGARR